ncbi:MAG: 50S ribosomal protein L11 methyltransferase [Solirubrobacteraceae bacterium]
MIRLAVRVPREQAELVLAELLELSPDGVEELLPDERTVEYAVYGAPGELPGLPDLRALAGGALVDISTREIADDWQERWKEFHRPVLIVPPAPIRAGGPTVPALRVRPPWEPAAAPAPGGDVVELVIDPGQAFGTGAHATTRLCLELLLELVADGQAPGAAVLDVGTGSGVLAIAAGLLGLGPLLGLDNEQESVQAAMQNAAVNHVSLWTERFDLRDQALPWLGPGGGGPPPDQTIVLANLLRPLLLALAGAIDRAPRHLIAGGLLTSELDEIAEAFGSSHGLRERDRRTGAEWGALWLSR